MNGCVREWSKMLNVKRRLVMLGMLMSKGFLFQYGGDNEWLCQGIEEVLNVKSRRHDTGIDKKSMFMYNRRSISAQTG